MDYTEFTSSQPQSNQSQQSQWSNLLTPNQHPPLTPSSSFPSPVSPQATLSDPHFQYYSSQNPAPDRLSLNLQCLSVTSPTASNLSPIGPLHNQIPHQGHAHSHSASSIPLSPVSPPSAGSVYTQTASHFRYGPPFDDQSSQPSLSVQPLQRRPLSALSPSSRSSSSSELDKSVPRKRSFTNADPARDTPHASVNLTDKEGLAHSLPHPIITTTASSPSPGSLNLPTHDFNRSRPSSTHGRPPRGVQTQMDVSPYDYDDPTGYNLVETPDESDVDHDANSFSAEQHPSFSSEYGFADMAGQFGPGAATTGSSQSPGANGSGMNTLSKPLGTNNFVTKLYHMISDQKSQQFITWTDPGTSFVVSNVGEFSRSILGSHFKHNNFSSFVRQLNMYGFHKINRTPRAHRTSTDAQTWEFSHHKFLRNRPDLLDEIKRKALEPDPGARHRIELPGEVAQQLRSVGEVRREFEVLRDEVGRLWDAVGRGSFSGDSGKDGEDDGRDDHEYEREDVKDASLVVGGGGSAAGGERDEWRRRARDRERMGQLPAQAYPQGQQLSPQSPFSPPSSQVDLARELARERTRAQVERNRDRTELAKERRRMDRLVGVVRDLCESLTKTMPGSVPQTIFQDLLELDNPGPELDSPNIYIISPTSPTHSPSPSPHPYPPHPHPHPHSPLSQPHPVSFPQPHPTQSHTNQQSHHPPVLTIPTLHSHGVHSPSHSPSHSLSHSPSSLSSHSHSLSHSSLSSTQSHGSSFVITPSSSPTGADFPVQFFGSGASGQGHGAGSGGGHGRSMSHASPSCLQPPTLSSQTHRTLSRQHSNASFTFIASPTPTSADGEVFEGLNFTGSDANCEGRREKRQRVGGEGDVTMSTSTIDEMDVEVEGGTGMGGNPNGVKRASRARSDSAPMGWVDGTGLSPNWSTGRPRSGSGFVAGGSRLGEGR